MKLYFFILIIIFGSFATYIRTEDIKIEGNSYKLEDLIEGITLDFPLENAFKDSIYSYPERKCLSLSSILTEHKYFLIAYSSPYV